ncbi:hypothetical protein A2U01_0074007, partial [Trifolium medium]|nr:hypothetical protein [Trifolium medium]
MMRMEEEEGKKRGLLCGVGRRVWCDDVASCGWVSWNYANLREMDSKQSVW